MARFSFQEADNYGGGKSNYFSLKDDGDTARIRFLINDINDLQGVATHSIQVGDRTIDVECLRAYNEPIENCPLCAANYKQDAKLFIPVYDEDAKESKIWSRGKRFFQKISSLCSRFNPLVSTVFEVERVGKKGDTSTTYETYNISSDNKQIQDFPEINAEGTCFQVKTFEELEKYLQTGEFDEEQQISRGTRQSGASRQQQTRAASREMPVRRRPNYNNEEQF